MLRKSSRVFTPDLLWSTWRLWKAFLQPLPEVGHDWFVVWLLRKILYFLFWKNLCLTEEYLISFSDQHSLVRSNSYLFIWHQHFLWSVSRSKMKTAKDISWYSCKVNNNINSQSSFLFSAFFCVPALSHQQSRQPQLISVVQNTFKKE